MYKYTITRETPDNVFGGYCVFEELETKNLKKLKQRLKQLNINDSLVKDINKEVKQAYRNFVEEIKAQNLLEKDILPVIYSPFLYKKPLFNPENPPDEMLFIEVEYYPIEELLKKIEIETGKQLKFPYPDQKIRVVKSYKQVILSQYSPQMKNNKTLLTYTLSRNNVDRVFELLKLLEGLFNEYID